jgi:hypothetical protein
VQTPKLGFSLLQVVSIEITRTKFFTVGQNNFEKKRIPKNVKLEKSQK